MTNDAGESVTLRQQLGAELRRLRDLAGVSGRDLATRIDISQSTLHRVETGGRAPSVPEVSAWCAATNADSTTRRHLVALAEAAKTETAPWRAALAGRPHMQEDAANLEMASGLVRSCVHDMLPGLLQTADYATALFPLVTASMAGHDTSTAVAARLRRQEVLYDQHKRFEFIITEATLRWSPAPGVMPAQLAKIEAVAAMPNVWLGVLPLSAQLGIFHSFYLYEDVEEAEPVVAIELPHGRITLNAGADVAMYREAFERWQAIAVTGDDAAALLRSSSQDQC